MDVNFSFIEYEKAFDIAKHNRSILILKLRSVESKAINIIKKHLLESESCIQSEISERSTFEGVPAKVVYCHAYYLICIVKRYFNIRYSHYTLLVDRTIYSKEFGLDMNLNKLNIWKSIKV